MPGLDGTQRFEAVGGGVGFVAEPLLEAEGDLLVHVVVLDEEDVEGNILGEETGLVRIRRD